MFEQETGYLAIAHVDIVGPFHPGLDSERGEGGLDGERYRFAEGKLIAGREIGGSEEEGKGEVAARLRLPGIAALAAPGGLRVGDDQHLIGEAGGLAGGVGVGGIGFGESENLHS